MWSSLMESYCKVEMVCYHGNPNWLGWFFLGILGIFSMLCLFLFLAGRLEAKNPLIWE